MNIFIRKATVKTVSYFWDKKAYYNGTFIKNFKSYCYSYPYCDNPDKIKKGLVYLEEKENFKTMTVCTIDILNKDIHFRLPFIQLKKMDYVIIIDFKNWYKIRKTYLSSKHKGFIFSIFYFTPLWRNY